MQISASGPPDLVVAIRNCYYNQVRRHASRPLISGLWQDGDQIFYVTEHLCQATTQNPWCRKVFRSFVHMRHQCHSFQNQPYLATWVLIFSSPNLIHGQTTATGLPNTVAIFTSIIWYCSCLPMSGQCYCRYTEIHSYDMPRPDWKKLKLEWASNFLLWSIWQVHANEQTGNETKTLNLAHVM